MSFTGCRRDAPDGRVVTIFSGVHRHSHKSDARTVGRDLGVARPDKIEQILLSNVSLLGQGRGGTQRERNGDTAQGKPETRSHRVSFRTRVGNAAAFYREPAKGETPNEEFAV